MDEKRLLEIVKSGCPVCSDTESLFVTGWESFYQRVSYLANYDQVDWEDPEYVGDTTSVKGAVVSCGNCGWDEEL